MRVEHLIERVVAEGREIVGGHVIGQVALQQVLLLFDYVARDSGVPGLDHFLTESAWLEEQVAQLRRRTLRSDEDAAPRRGEDPTGGMEDDLPGIPASPGRLEHAFIIFALVVVPHTFA